jgi:hypothetical protein
MYFTLGADLKMFVGAKPEIQLNKMSEQSLICAAEEMLAYYETHNLDFTVDDQGQLNEGIFAQQEAC